MGGTIYQEIMNRAAHLPLINDYLAGRIGQNRFRSELFRYQETLLAAGINSWWLELLARFPNDQWQSAMQLLNRLYADGLIKSPELNKLPFTRFEQLVDREFTHLSDRYTSIFPEESRIAYALSCALSPRSVFVAGSYYGYLAVWLVPGLAEGGRIICSDVDPAVCRLARQNMSKLGANASVDVICDDAEKLLQSSADPIDLLVLDAYGGFDHPDSQYHGKAIYAPLLRAALPRLHKNSYILVHNADINAPELVAFFQLIAAARLSLFLDTTDHLAVFQL